MKKLTCCCGATHELPEDCGTAFRAMLDAAPRWGMAWDIGSGMKPVWLCPTCTWRAKDALEVLRGIFAGHELGHINFLPLLRQR